MKPIFLLPIFAFAALSAAQTPDNASPAGASSTVQMSDATIMKAMSALKMGKTVTITVDNRTVAYTPRLIGKMLFVPVRLFSETGQRVTWDGTDMRATIRQDNGPQKNSVEYDAKRGEANFKPGATMRPVYDKGRLWVPLASGLGAFGLLAEWVPASNRINVKSNRPG